MPDEITLGEKQRIFSHLVGKLIEKIYVSGFEVTFGEAWRPPTTAEYYAKVGKGIRNSLHTQRLAVDLNLFKDGKFLSDSEQHRQFGEWWEQQHPLCRWGGRFKDGNHYSMEHNGIK